MKEKAGGLLGGGGQRVCWPPSQIIPPPPPSSYAYDTHADTVYGIMALVPTLKMVRDVTVMTSDGRLSVPGAW